MRENKNFLILTLDGVRADAARALGNPDLVTPNLDALCARGLRYHSIFLSGGLERFDGAAEAMLHTGRCLSGLVRDGETIPADHALLGEVLGENGFRTFGAGRWRTDPDAFRRSFQSGEILSAGGAADAERCAELACDFLRDAGNRPFFLYAGFGAPAVEDGVPERFSALYDPSALTLPFGLEDTAENRLRLREAYAWISCQDEAAGRILGVLQELSLENDTLVIVTALRGCSLGRHGIFTDTGWRDENIRIPMIAAGPSVAVNDKSGALISLADLFPTICWRKGLPLPAGVQGRNCSICLEEPTGHARDWSYFVWSDRIRGFLNGTSKALSIREGETYRMECYRLEEDPEETDPRPGTETVEEFMDELLEEYSLVLEDRASPAARAFWNPSRRRRGLV